MRAEDDNKKTTKSKAGRKPKEFPAVHKYYVRLNSADMCRLEGMFDLSEYKYRSHFIRDKVLNTPLKLKIIDKTRMDYIIMLSAFRGQMRKIGNNYNQLIRLLKEQLGEKKALTFLYKLEKATIELVNTYKEIEDQIQKLEEK